MGRIAAIDFGKKRIGLALSDPLQIIASPLTILLAEGTLRQTAERIFKELSPYFPLDLLIIGLPLMPSGKDGDMSLLVKDFAEVLRQLFPFPLLLWDERLTSKQVEKSLIEQGVNRKKRTKILDSRAAAAILQNYLDSRCIQPTPSLKP
jgi:putative pre-16S rRNA nuclease